MRTELHKSDGEERSAPLPVNGPCSGPRRQSSDVGRRDDPWEPTRRFFEALEKLREEEAKRGPVKLYTLKEPRRGN